MKNTKNWTGNKKSTYVTLGASNHTEKERQKDDYYATHPSTVKPLFENENFIGPIWECACGEGHLAKEIEKKYELHASDLVDRGYGVVLDFFKRMKWDGDIITNPPYKYAQEFVEHSLKIIPDGRKVAMFLKIQFLEGQKRRKLFESDNPKVVYVFSKRQSCAMNGDFEKYPSSAVAYAWFVWEKGYKGDTIVKWI